jgi:hypothetical protein
MDFLDLRHHRLDEVVARATDAVDRLEAAHRLTARLLTDRISEKPGSAHRATTPH